MLNSMIRIGLVVLVVVGCTCAGTLTVIALETEPEQPDVFADASCGFPCDVDERLMYEECSMDATLEPVEIGECYHREQAELEGRRAEHDVTMQVWVACAYPEYEHPPFSYRDCVAFTNAYLETGGKVEAVRSVVEDWLEWGGPRHVGIDPDALSEGAAE